MQPILDFPFDLRTPTNKQTLCKLNRCDAGWWRYQLNTKWWYRQGNPRQCGNASGNTINRTNWLEMGQTSKSQGAHAAILDFPFDLGTPTNRGERSNLRLQHLLTWILPNFWTILCPNFSMWVWVNFRSDKKLHLRMSFDRYKSLMQFWALCTA